MKLCHACGQALVKTAETCIECGISVDKGLERVDQYRILEIIHEGSFGILCRAESEADETPVALRLFPKSFNVNDELAQKLNKELDDLGNLPDEWFVQHHHLKCAANGLWFQTSEWLDIQSWGDVLGSSRLRKIDAAYNLFYRLATILDNLHKIGRTMPYLTLSNIKILRDARGAMDVKLDYKLSRLLSLQKVEPDTPLQNLLDCHPDIIKKRSLNVSSDIWSLGRIFTQILAVDLELCDPLPVVKEKKFPKEIDILIRSMLTDDPDLRPRSLAEVVLALNRIKKERAAESTIATKNKNDIKKPTKAILAFGMIITIMAIIGGIIALRYEQFPVNEKLTFAEFVDYYAESVAFVVVEYQIKTADEVLYSNRTEGTAFLVDNNGYLLTNRHVACPWLEDRAMYRIISYLQTTETAAQFDYQIYLWFEGDTAFNRLFDIGENKELEDVYDTASAFQRQGALKVEIAGVAKAPAQRGEMIKAPLRDDFAVLKISPVPTGLHPLPLARNYETENLKRLASVIALGFPLGRTIQVNTINVSVTRGHIRRTFENFFQVDTSIYKGNSGGPIIDEYGRVIGIASAVATDIAMAPLPVITPLSDIGLVLPVAKAAEFIDELKAGQSKWNGVLDLSAAGKIQEITEAAYLGNWREAEELAKQSLIDSDSPALLMTAAMIFYCTGNDEESYRLFNRVLSIDPDRYQARLMGYLLDRRFNSDIPSRHGNHLLAMTWHSSGEFFGHLARIFEEDKDGIFIDSWNNSTEKAWVYYVAGVRHLENGNMDKATALLREAAKAAQKDEWPMYLTLAMLARLAQEETDGLEKLSEFLKELRKSAKQRQEVEELTSKLMTEFEKTKTEPKKRAEILHDVSELQPDNKKLIAYAAFYEAMSSQWTEALDTASKYLQLDGREESLRLATRVLVGGILKQLDKQDDAREHLEEIRRMTDTPWYRQICDTLLHNQSATELIDSAGNVPEKILTAYTALGFSAEAAGNHGLAVQYYREALGSYLDNWTEYELARQRFLKLREDAKNP